MGQDTERLKRAAAEAAVEAAQTGMVVGLGEGSTAELAVRALAQRLSRGSIRDIVCVAASRRMGVLAQRLGLMMTSLEDHPAIDLTIDGADEVDPNLNLIKGGGGALLYEKILAQASHREVIVVDESKLSSVLGTHWALPVEVVPFGWRTQQDYLSSLGAEARLRQGQDGKPFATDQGNVIVDCAFGPIEDAHALAHKLEARTGIVEHGLFLGMASEVIVAGAAGVRRLEPPMADLDEGG